jgi:hypothetical protein
MTPATRSRSTALFTACAGFVLVAPLLLAWTIDPRQIASASPWVKPLKFALSFSLHWLTITLALHRLRGPTSQTLAWAVAVGAFATIIETAAIVLQSARGVPSHFNQSSAPDAAIYFGIMGPAALGIVGATFAVGWSMHTDVRARPAAQPRGTEAAEIDRALALGLMLSAVLTLVVAAPMAAGVTASPEALARRATAALPILGWSGSGGDLRAAHFLGTHLAQALPLAAWLAHRHRTLAALLRPAAVATGSTVVVLALAVQAVLDRPFIRLATLQ